MTNPRFDTSFLDSLSFPTSPAKISVRKSMRSMSLSQLHLFQDNLVAQIQVLEALEDAGTTHVSGYDWLMSS